MASLRPVRPRNAPGTAVAPLRAGRERIIRQGQAACVGKTIVTLPSFEDVWSDLFSCTVYVHIHIFIVFSMEVLHL